MCLSGRMTTFRWGGRGEIDRGALGCLEPLALNQVWDVPTLFLLFLPDQHQGGAAAETDQLIPEVEEALLQTEGPNSLLCQRCQGELSAPDQRLRRAADVTSLISSPSPSVCWFGKRAFDVSYLRRSSLQFFFSSYCFWMYIQAASVTARLDILESSANVKGHIQLERKHSGACISTHFTNLLFTDKSAVQSSQSSAKLMCFNYFFSALLLVESKTTLVFFRCLFGCAFLRF